MLPRIYPDRFHVAFDDHRLVANVGLILPAILARHFGLPQLVDRHWDLGHASGRGNRPAGLIVVNRFRRRAHRAKPIRPAAGV